MSHPMFQRLSGILAAIVLAGSFGDTRELFYHRKTADHISGRMLAEQMHTVLESHPETEFAQLRFDKQQNTLYQDGKAVGSSFAGFHAENGELKIAASELRKDSVYAAEGEPAYLSLQEAVDTVGLEVREDADSIIISAPFQTHTLIVNTKAESLDVHGGKALAQWDDFRVISYDTAADTYQAYQAFQAEADVIAVEPNRIVHAASFVNADTVQTADTEQSPHSWGWEAIGVPSFRQLLTYQTSSQTPVVVAILDTGIYQEHKWFEGRIAEGGISLASEYDDANNWNDRNGHGTHCAGIIADMTSDQVKLLPVKVLDDSGNSNILRVYCGMLYAKEQHADIINMSFGGEGFSPLMQKAVSDLYESNILCVAAASNDAEDVSCSNPANIPAAIAVSALSRTPVDNTDPNSGYKYVFSSFSNRGELIDFSAPGDGILSAGIGNPDELILKSGTSMAAPHVTGCIANLLEYDRSLTADQICHLLQINAIDYGETGHDPFYGWGMINLNCFRFSDDSGTSPVASVQPGTYDRIQQVRLEVPEPDAVIYYSTDGSDPLSENGIQYTGAIEIRKTTMLLAVAVTPESVSPIFSGMYTIQCSPPVPSVPSGSYSGSVSVSLDAPAHYAVYYTTDGSVPTPETGMLYDGSEIAITDTTILQACSAVGDTVSQTMVCCYIIDDAHKEKLLVVQDGVLCSYFGDADTIDLRDYPEPVTAIQAHAFEKKDMLTKILLPDTVTEIGDYAFADCTALQSVSAPGVLRIGDHAFDGCTLLSYYQGGNMEEIGDHAFYQCEQLEMLPLQWGNHVQAIGDYAFANSGVRLVSLPQNRQFGSYVFDHAYRLTEAILSDDLEALPDGIFNGCDSLSLLMASGVTKIGSDALHFQNHTDLKETTIPFSRITEIGYRGFSGVDFYQFGQPVVSFDSLTTVTTDSFYLCYADTFSMPALEQIPTNALDKPVLNYLYLEHVQAIRDYGIHLETDMIQAIVVGSDLQVVAEDAFGNELWNLNALAGPEDSVLAGYAAHKGIRFYNTPYIYCRDSMDQDVFVLNQNDHTPVKVRVFGFGGTLKYTATDPEKAVRTAENGFYPDTSESGDQSYQIALYGEDGELLARETVRVIVQEVFMLEPAAECGLYPIIPEQNSTQYADAPVSRMSCMKFTPEISGAYYIYAAGYDYQISIVDGESTLTEPYTIMDPQAAEALQLEAGKTYQILIEQMGITDYTAISISTDPPGKRMISYAMNDLKLFYPEGTEKPEFVVSDDSGVLTENEDYVLFYDTLENGGCVMAVGIGAYIGSFTQKWYYFRDADATGLIAEYEADACECYRFVAEETGEQCLYLDFTDVVYEKIRMHDRAFERLAMPMWQYNLTLYLYDSDMEELKPEMRSWNPLDQAVFQLEAGKEYYVQCRLLNQFATNIGEPLFRLYSRPYAEDHSIRTVNFNYDAVHKYDGKPLQCIQSAYDEDGNPLTEGVDYEVIPIERGIPGEYTLLIRGIGSYFGLCEMFGRITLDEELVESAPCTKIEVGVPFTQTGEIGFYQFELDSNTTLSLREINGSQSRFDTVLFWESLGYNTDNTWSEETQDAYSILIPEQYHFYLRQYDDTPHTYILVDTDEYQDFEIKDEEISVKERYAYTGSEIKPEVTIEHGGKKLRENLDYVVYANEDICACGCYELYISGIGDYTGYKTVNIWVLPAAEGDCAELKPGDNFIQISNAKSSTCCVLHPESETSAIQVDSPLSVSYEIYDESGELTVRKTVSGFDFAEFRTDPQKTYYVYVSFLNKSQTGTVNLQYRTDYTPLHACRLDAPEQVPASESGFPPYRIYDGDTELVEGRDYICFSHGGEDQIGYAEMTFEGIGRYAGLKEYEYYRCPDFADVLTMEQTELIDSISRNRGCPGYRECFAFEAPEHGLYQLNAPNIKRDGVCAFVWRENGEQLSALDEPTELRKGEKLYLLAVTNYMNSGYSRQMEYTISVTCTETIAENTFVTIDNIIYEYIPGQGYVLSDYADDLYGIYVPDQIYSEETQQSEPIFGIADAFIEKAAGNITIYYDSNDRNMAELCRSNGLCGASWDPITEMTGDITGDGMLDQNDILTLIRVITEGKGMHLTDTICSLSDQNGDGILNLADVNLLTDRIRENEEAVLYAEQAL